MGAAKLLDQDLGWKKLRETLRRTTEARIVRVGVQGDQGTAPRGDGINGATLAAVHEFGSPTRNIPERSFIRAPIDENGEKYHSFMTALGWRVLNGALTSKAALGFLGTRVVADIKRRIQRGIDPELKPATIRRKESSKQLIDTGQLLNSITHEVGVREEGD